MGWVKYNELKAGCESLGISFSSVYKKVLYDCMSEEEAIRAVSTTTIRKEERRKYESLAVQYNLSVKDVRRALNTTPPVLDDTPLLLGWPLSYWVNSVEDLKFILDMERMGIPLQEVREKYSVPLSLHPKRCIEDILPV